MSSKGADGSQSAGSALAFESDRAVVVQDDAELGSRPQDPFATHDRNLVEHMVRLRESPLDFFRDLSLHIKGSGWRSYEHIVGQPIFYSGFTAEIKKAVMATAMVREKMEALTTQRLRVEEEEGLLGASGDLREQARNRKIQLQKDLREVVDKMLDNMVCQYC